MPPIASAPDALFSRPAENIRAIGARVRRVRARDRRVPPRLGRSEWLTIVAVSAVLILIIGIGFDRISVERARALPGFVVSIFQIVSDAGKSQWELYPAAIFVILLLFGRWTVVPRFARAVWAEAGALAAFVFASIGGVGLVVNIVKQPIGRGRPITFDEFGAFTLHHFQFEYAFQSFPSGHSATGGALIALGFLVFTRWRVGLLLFGLAIGASRVVVQAHYPSDVAAGLILGFAFTMWLAGVFATAGWAFQRDATGTIRARSGAIRRACRDPAGLVIALAGLVDAMAGRAVFIPALASIGDGAHGRSNNRIGPPDDDA